MNEESDKISTESNDNPRTPVNRDKKTSRQKPIKPKKSTVVPQISAFFENPEVSPSAFLKALRSEKIMHFKSEDKARALSAIESDTSGARLWALMSQAKLPQVVNRWLWPVAQNRLKSAVGTDFSPDGASPSDILENLCKVLMPRLGAKERVEAKGAEVWLRIGLCWLIETKAINPWEIAEVISSSIFADTKAANSLFRRAISKGSQKELRLSVATIMIGNQILARWKSDLARERRVSDDLSIKLDAAERTKNSLSAELAETREELVQQENALERAKKQLEDERQHWGHDLTETKAKQRRFLEKIKPQLADAIDELEMEPADPEAALEHLEPVLKIFNRINHDEPCIRNRLRNHKQPGLNCNPRTRNSSCRPGNGPPPSVGSVVSRRRQGRRMECEKAYGFD